jgi:hypothetical protein
MPLFCEEDEGGEWCREGGVEQACEWFGEEHCRYGIVLMGTPATLRRCSCPVRTMGVAPSVPVFAACSG